MDGFAGAARGTILVKVLDEGTSPSCPAVLSLICLVPVLFVTLILAYWPSLSKRPTFVSSSLSQVASFAVRVSATYSASVDESATVTCLFKH